MNHRVRAVPGSGFTRISFFKNILWNRGLSSALDRIPETPLTLFQIVSLVLGPVFRKATTICCMLVNPLYPTCYQESQHQDTFVVVF